MSVTDRQAESRPARSRALRRALVGVAIALAAQALVDTALWLWLDRRWSREVEAERAAMARDGLLVPIDTLLPPAVVPEQNAAGLYHQALDACGAFMRGLKDNEASALSTYAREGPDAFRRPEESADMQGFARIPGIGGPVGAPGSYGAPHGAGPSDDASRPPGDGGGSPPGGSMSGIAPSPGPPGMGMPPAMPPGPPPPPPVSVEDCRRLLDRPEARRALRLLEAASRKPRCVFPVRWEKGVFVWTRLASRRYVRDGLALTLARARSELAARRPDDAIQSCLVGFRVGSHLVSVPSRFEQDDYGRAVASVLPGLRDVLAQAPLRPSEAAKLDALLAFIDTTQAEASATALRLDVAEHDRFYDLLRREPGRAYALMGHRWEETRLRFSARLYYSPIGRPLQRLDHLYYLWSMRSIAALAPRPYREVANEFDLISSRLWSQGPFRFVVDFVDRQETANALALLYTLHWPAEWPILCLGYDRQSMRRDMTSAQIGLTRTLLALEAYRASHGHYPAALSDMPGTRAAQVSLDPFSGRPFLYSRTAGGLRLHSIGPDLVDDGGKPMGESIHDKGDIVVECGPRSQQP